MSSTQKNEPKDTPEGGTPATELLPIAAIRRDGGTQMRFAMETATVQEYAEQVRAGAMFPPIIAFHDGSNYWLADGFHRVEAHQAAGVARIEAIVKQGSARDAKLYAASANARHGLRRTNADKRAAVFALLDDDEWGQWSDRKIADVAAVTHPFVAKLRKERIQCGNSYHPAFADHMKFLAAYTCDEHLTWACSLWKTQSSPALAAAARLVQERMHSMPRAAWFEYCHKLPPDIENPIIASLTDAASELKKRLAALQTAPGDQQLEHRNACLPAIRTLVETMMVAAFAGVPCEWWEGDGPRLGFLPSRRICERFEELEGEELRALIPRDYQPLASRFWNVIHRCETLKPGEPAKPFESTSKGQMAMWIAMLYPEEAEAGDLLEG